MTEIKYETIGQTGKLETITFIPVEKFGKTTDEALANFLAAITWMDSW